MLCFNQRFGMGFDFVLNLSWFVSDERLTNLCFHIFTSFSRTTRRGFRKGRDNLKATIYFKDSVNKPSVTVEGLTAIKAKDGGQIILTKEVWRQKERKQESVRQVCQNA